MVADEASSLSTIYYSAEGYPEPLRSQLKSELRDYTHYVIEKDWPAHRQVRVLVRHADQAERHHPDMGTAA